MTQQVCHVRVSFPNSQSLGDPVTHSYTIEATGSSSGLNFTDTDLFFNDLYTTAIDAMVLPLGKYLSGNLSRATNAVSVSYTDVTAVLNGGPAGPAVHESFLTLPSANDTNDLPDHDAITIGYRAAYGSDIEKGPSASLPSDESAIDEGAPSTHTGTIRPRARDRGRIYMGPFCFTAMAATGGVPSAQALSDLGIWANAAFGVQRSGDADQFNLVVWSRRAAAVKQVSFIYVDEGFTAQRRRGDTTAARVHSWESVGSFVLAS